MKLQEGWNILELDLMNRAMQLEKEMKFYSNHDNCPTCKQGIEHSFKETVISESVSKSSDIMTGLQQLTEKRDLVDKRIEEISIIEDVITKCHSDANELRLENKMIMNQMKAFKKDLLNAEKEAEEIVAKNDRIIASERDRLVFFNAVFSNSKPNERLAAAATKYHSKKS